MIEKPSYEELEKILLDEIPLLICHSLPCGKITFINKAYCKYFDKTHEELFGRNFLSLIPKGDRKMVTDNLSLLTVDSPELTITHQVISSNGYKQWHRWVNKAIFNNQGQAVAFQSIGEDVTEFKKLIKDLGKSRNELEAQVQKRTVELKQQNEQLKYSEELFKSLFEQTTGYAMILQPSSSGIPTILNANKAACDAHGFECEELIGRPVTDLDDDEGKQLCIERTKLILSGVTLEIETNHIRKDGSVFPVAVFANVVRFKNRPPVILTTEYDITNRKQAEKDLEIYHGELEKKKAALEEANIALRVLLKNQEVDRKNLEDDILFNVSKLIEPNLEKVKKTSSVIEVRKYLEIIESNINEITSSFSPRLGKDLSKLTPAEIKIVNLIKQGKSSKEIAALSNLSITTITTHRQKIRKKLDLTNKKINLQTFFNLK